MKYNPSKPSNFSDTVTVFVKDDEGKELFTIRANQVEDKWLGDIANLLCAAPDLFTAADNWLKLQDHDGISDMYSIQAVLKQMRDAVAKAKGESQ